jgi:exodeoxyribonuclease VII large subunit
MEDFQKTIARNVPFVRVMFIETRVQGVGAEIDIAAALDEASKGKTDVIVLTRGGGTYEDLFPFNLEPVIRAIVRAKVPVLTAIGHSGDHHLADDVADMAFGTPSLAAEHIAKGWILAARRLAELKRDLDRAIRDVILRGEQRTDARGKELERFGLRVVAAKRRLLAERIDRLERRNPQRVLSDFRARVARGFGRLEMSVSRVLSQKTTRLMERMGALNRYDPIAPLSLGYAIVTKDGRALRRAAEAQTGDVLDVRLERGSLQSRVESVTPDE